jgi:Amt family ammonium transporter
MDFAGSGIVHLVGGVGALCGAVIVGPRRGRFDPEAAADFDGHSVPFCVLGTFFLWFGWYGFNPGSTGAMHDRATANTAGLVAVNTTLSPCVSGLLVFFLRAKVLSPKLLDVGGFCNGILAGLVAITAGCANVEPWEAIIIGLVGGLVYQGASMLLRRLRVDDVVDAFPVHGACGLWGLLALGLFGNPDEGMGGNGAFYGGDQLGTQIFAGLLIIVWAGVLSVLIFLPLRKAGMLRMGDEFQEKGADLMEHSPAKAYAQDRPAGVDTPKMAPGLDSELEVVTTPC